MDYASLLPPGPQSSRFLAPDSAWRVDRGVLEPGFKGKLFILIDGGGASTTGHLLGLLKYHKIGTLIGEETGGTFVCHNAHNSFQLKHTRFQVTVATGTFASAVKDLPKDRGILPDILVYPRPEDFAAGKDTILEYALSLIRH